MTEQKKEWSHIGVALFIPNLIGYARFVSLAVCPMFALDKANWHWFLFCYCLSYALDAVDGRAARMFDQ